MSRRLTQDEVIAKFRAVHGDRYDYSEFVYTNTKSKGTIRCFIHGPFLQVPWTHLTGSGCYACGREAIGAATAVRDRLPLAMVLETFRRVHGELYDYSEFVYAGTNTKGTIRCFIHGPFLQRPSNHLQGSGCPACAHEANAAKKRLSLAAILEAFRRVHGDRYDYSEFVYAGTNTNGRIHCLVHGPFLQTASNHSHGNGCPACASEAIAARFTAPLASVLEAFARVHGSRYDYTEFVYVSNTTKGKILCREHGAFWQSAAHHKQGSACPQCRVFTTICLNGIIYRSITDAMRAVGSQASMATIVTWLKAGMEPQEAFFRVPNIVEGAGVVYLIMHKTGKTYVGITLQSLERRWAGHLRDALRRLGPPGSLQEAIREHGPDAFQIFTVASAPDPKSLAAMERAWIRDLRTQVPLGYNILAGGQIGGGLRKKTRIGDHQFPSVRAAAEDLAIKLRITVEAAEQRIRNGRIHVTPRFPRPGSRGSDAAQLALFG